jgi:autotransporter-associated beta strand protein
MNTPNILKRIPRTPLLRQSALAFALLLVLAGTSMAQTSWFWRNNESRGNNWGTANRWWNGAGATLSANSSNNINLVFDGGTELTSTNDVTNLGVRGIIFNNSGSSRTLDGNILRVSEGGVGKIENGTANAQTINLTLSNNTANGMEINPVLGQLNLSNVYLGTNYVDLFGANTVDFRGEISGSAIFTMKTNSGIVTAKFSASNSMTGTVNIDRGILILNSTNATAGTGTINIGIVGGGYAPELQFGTAAALANNVANNINIVANSGGSRIIRSQNTSGTNVVTGTLANTNSGLVSMIYQKNGGTLRFSNTVSGAGGFFLDGGTDSGGTVEFSSSNSFSGGFFIDNGTLKLGTAVATAGTGALGLGAGSGAATNSNATVRLSAAAGGITLNNSSLQVRAGTGQRSIISENTSGTNTITGGITLSNSLAFNVTNGGTLLFSGAVTPPADLSTVRLAIDGGGTLISTGTTTTGTGNYQVRIGNGTLIIGAGSLITRTNVDGLGHAIDLGVDLNGSIVNNASRLFASNGITVSNSIYVSTTNSQSRVIGMQDQASSSTATFSGPIALAGATLSAQAGTNTTVTVSGAVTTFSGTSGLTKTGAGTVVLTGNSTYNGATTVSEGRLNLNATTGSAIASTASVSVASGAALLISKSEQVNDSATLTLSGGTLFRAAAVSETMSDLTISSASTIDYGNTAESIFLKFGSVTGGANLTISSFKLDNKFQFAATDFAAGQTIANTFSFTSSDNRGFSFSSGTFTITAIPEPSTVLAALGLTGLLLWPLRRRLVGRSL